MVSPIFGIVLELAPDTLNVFDASKRDKDSWKAQVDDLTKEIKVHQADVKVSKVRAA